MPGVVTSLASERRCTQANLRVGLARDLYCFGYDGLTVCGLFALNRVFDREDMLAPRVNS